LSRYWRLIQNRSNLHEIRCLKVEVGHNTERRESNRLGVEKGLVKINGRSLVCWVVDLLDDVVDEIIVVVSSDKVVPHYRGVLPSDVRVVPDCYPDKSPLIGLISGLKECRGEYAAACACDMPLLNPAILRLMFSVSEGLSGVQLVKPNGWIEPLPSIYRVAPSLVHEEALRAQGELRLRKVFETMPDPVFLPVERLRYIDPDLVSFRDVDTMEQAGLVGELLAKKLG